MPLEDVAALEAISRREGVTLSQWVARQVTRADTPARASAQAHAEPDEAKGLRAEAARLREETVQAVTLAPEAMALLEHLFQQCGRLWPEYQACV